jgi:hypothetical protein
VAFLRTPAAPPNLPCGENKKRLVTEMNEVDFFRINRENKVEMLKYNS